MNSKKVVRMIAIILAIIMLFSIVMIAIDALAGTRASASVTQDQIRRLREEKKEYESEKREINSRINTIEFERMAEMDRKQVLDERISLTGREIDNINETINQYNMLITEKEYEIIIAQNREEEQLAKYKARVRDMEEKGIISYFEILFDSTSFSDLLARLDFVNDIMRADENVYNALQQAQQITVYAKEALEVTKAELNEELENLEILKAEIEVQLEEAHALILKMEADLELQRQLRDQVIESENRVQKEINALEEELRKQRELERQRLLAAQRANQTTTSTQYISGTGELMWPVNGRVTSYFGIRRHPVYGDNRMHTGIDIAASHGTVIVAADSGVVLTSSYDSGYGNYVVVSHGGGVTTLYAHMSSRSVSVGTSVTKGQQLGLVGSTCVSTGPHLHFEVSVNGSRINPLNRL